METPTLSRRDALKAGTFAAAALALPLAGTLAAKDASTLSKSKIVPYRMPFATPPLALPVPDAQRPAKWQDSVRASQGLPPVDFYRLEQTEFSGTVLSGVTTKLWGYGGCVPGPTIRMNRGRKVVVRQVNKLPARHPQLGYEAWTSTHLHGSPSKPQFDGYASDVTYPGEWKDYEYENTMTPRTLWYHDHGVHHTAENAYMGLAGQYQCIETLADTSNVVLPNVYGWNDFPLVISDKAFSSNGNLLFNDEGHSSTFGDVITVNGVAWPVMKVERRLYRFRVLNASTSRGYRLRMSDGRRMALIGTDAGLTTNVRYLTDYRHGMAERYEVLIDFRGDSVGRSYDLQNLGVPNSRDFDHTGKVMRFEVVADGQGTAIAPAPTRTTDEGRRQLDVRMPADGVRLSPGAPAMDLTDAMVVKTRNLELTRQNGQWTVGPYTWEQVVDSGYTRVFADPQPNTVEKWIVKNSSGGWFHPVHIHLVDFKVTRRNGRAPYAWEAAGGKDVVYVGENETVELLMRFHPNDRGLYMIHCHNLTHEDHDMMTQFRVGPEVRDSYAMYTDGEEYHDEAGNRVPCDKDDPIFAAHPCSSTDS